MKNKLNSVLKRIIILLLGIYVVYTFFSQQSSLNSYAAGQEYYSEKIAEEVANRESLLELKDNLNSPEYIEKIAREKLDMYLPNERVYLDIEN